MELIEQAYERLTGDPVALDRESQAAVQISEASLRKDMSTHCSEYLTWSRFAVIAEQEWKSAEASFKEVEAQCRINARKMQEAAGKKPTDEATKELATLDTVLIAAKETMITAEANYGHFRRIENALWQRKAMIESLNARQMRENSTWRTPPDIDDNRIGPREQTPDYAQPEISNATLEELKAQCRAIQGRK